TFAPTKAFNSVDLPELGAPIRATKPARVSARAVSVSVGGGLVGVAILARSRLRLSRDHSEKELSRNLLGQALGAPGGGGGGIPLHLDPDREGGVVVGAVLGDGG